MLVRGGRLPALELVQRRAEAKIKLLEGLPECLFSCRTKTAASLLLTIRLLEVEDGLLDQFADEGDAEALADSVDTVVRVAEVDAGDPLVEPFPEVGLEQLRRELPRLFVLDAGLLDYFGDVLAEITLLLEGQVALPADCHRAAAGIADVDGKAVVG